MIGLDTNILVRLLVEDDPPQVRLVRGLLQRCHEADAKCLVLLLVLCELEWVLTSCYKVPRDQIAAAVQAILADPLFEVEQPQVVQEALVQYRLGKGDLSDYLLGARSRSFGAETTYTMDKALRDSEQFTLLKAQL